MVPNGWEVKKFGDLFNVKSGFGFKHSEYVDSGTPLIKIDNVSHGYVKWNNVSYLPDIYREEYSDILLKEGDLLLALNRPITQGKLKLVKLTKNDVPSILYQRVGRIDFKTNDLEKDFYLYLLDTAIYRFVSHKAIGSDQPFISTTELKKLNIVKPPLPEQRKIAKILSTWDKAISTTERLIDNSKQQKKALMQQLLTGAHTQRKRLLDDSGKPFEGEWEEVKLGDVSDVRDGTHDSPSFIDSGYPLITSKNLLPSGKLDLNNVKFISKEDYEQINKRSNVNVGDILFGMIGTIGNPVRVSSNDYAIKNVALIKEKQSLLNSFLIFYISSLDIAKQFHRLNAGGTQKFIALGVIRNLVIRMPTHEEQLKIAAVLTNADKEIELLEQQLADLKQEKKALMQQLLTGKRRVIVDEKDVA